MLDRHPRDGVGRLQRNQSDPRPPRRRSGELRAIKAYADGDAEPRRAPEVHNRRGPQCRRRFDKVLPAVAVSETMNDRMAMTDDRFDAEPARADIDALAGPAVVEFGASWRALDQIDACDSR